MDDNFDVILDNGQVIDMHNSNNGWKCPKCGNAIHPRYAVCPICGGRRTNENLAPGETMILS